MTITIPNSVTRVGICAFKGCSSLISVEIPNSVTMISSYTFSDCSNLSSISIPESVTMISSYAFYGCTGLTSVMIPNSVRTIGDYVFENCSGLTSVTIPSSVTSIGTNAFSCSGLTSVYYNGDVAGWCGITFENVMANPLSSAHNLYIDNELVTDVNVSGVIKEYAFCYATCLRSATIGGSVGTCAFYRCSELSIVTIQNCSSIGNLAFSGCSGLTSITIPNSVYSIGDGAFSGCSGLTTVNFNSYNCNSMGNSNSPVFGGCTSLATLNIGNNVTRIPDYAFMGFSGLSEITISNSVTSIGNYAFKNCSGLKSVTIPNSVNSIGVDAFSGCSGLVEMTIPFVGRLRGGASQYTLFGAIFGTSSYDGGRSVTQYYDYNTTVVYYVPSSLRSVTVTDGGLQYGAFSGCFMLTSVTIPNSITRIPDHAFQSCSGLTRFTIPNSITGIGESAFANCYNMTSVTIGNSVTGIGRNAFLNCFRLTDIYAKTTTPPSISYEYNPTFSSYTATVWVPCGSAETYRVASGWSNFNDIRESGALMLSATSANIQYGTASVIQQPTCTDATAIIAATPNTGYRFMQWNDGNTDNPRTVNVISEVEYVANFAAIPLYMVSAVSDNETMGTVSGGGTYYEGDTATLSVTPNRGYIFTQWNDGNADNPRIVIVSEDVEYVANFTSIPSYMVSAVSDNETMGIVSGGGTYYEGDTATLTVTPNRGFGFTQWNDGNTDNPRIVIVTEDVEYIASFVALPSYTITVTSANETMGTVSGGGTYYEGETAVLRATPVNDLLFISSYGFVSWDDGNTDNPRRIVVAENASYTAFFSYMRRITVVSADENMGTVSGGGRYPEGSQAVISATAQEHYHFTQWQDGNTDNPRTITVVDTATYIASFAIDQHTITVAANDGTFGNVSDGGTYDYGTEIQISAIANEHYHFDQWTDGNTDNPRTIIVTEDTTYVAEFAIDRFTITVESADVSMGTVSETGTYDYGTEIQISATANNGYHFVQWNDGNTDNPRTITVFEDATYTATFIVNRYTITVESSNTAMGTVSESGTYDYGTEIQISATANNGYHFVQWNDENTDNPRTITVIEDAIYTATFTVNRYTITVESSNTAMGTVSESGTYDYGTEIQISATAYDGNMFASWDDGNTENPRTITVVADAIYIASFVPTVGIDENVVYEINIFPNPATDILNITSSETISEIEIVNEIGQVVMKKGVNADNVVCDVKDLRSGMYVVRIYNRVQQHQSSNILGCTLEANNKREIYMYKFIKE